MYIYIYILESACALRAHLILLLAAQDQDRHFMAVYVLPMMVSVATQRRIYGHLRLSSFLYMCKNIQRHDYLDHMSALDHNRISQM